MSFLSNPDFLNTNQGLQVYRIWQSYAHACEKFKLTFFCNLKMHERKKKKFPKEIIKIS